MEKILVVEDEREIREIERDYLEKEGYSVLEADNGEEALITFREESPDLVILDLNIPFKDGIEVCKSIREKSGVPIIMVTARTKEIDELLGLEVGADDYIKKPFSPNVLVARVKALLKRPDYSEKTGAIRIGDLEIDVEKQVMKRDGKIIELTTVQFNILTLLVTNRGKVFSRNELIEGSYDTYDFPDIFDRTIDSHIKNLRKQIEENSRKPKYILTVRGKGYKFNDDV